MFFRALLIICIQDVTHIQREVTKLHLVNYRFSSKREFVSFYSGYSPEDVPSRLERYSWIKLRAFYFYPLTHRSCCTCKTYQVSSGLMNLPREWPKTHRAWRNVASANDAPKHRYIAGRFYVRLWVLAKNNAALWTTGQSKRRSNNVYFRLL